MTILVYFRRTWNVIEVLAEKSGQSTDMHCARSLLKVSRTSKTTMPARTCSGPHCGGRGARTHIRGILAWYGRLSTPRASANRSPNSILRRETRFRAFLEERIARL